MTTYNVVARRWKRGWELHIEGAGVTQVRRLGEAEGMVRDYMESLTGEDASEAIVVVRPEAGDGLDQEARAAREAVAAADRMTREAAARSRKVARDLRSAGLSGREIAAILDVSAQRVSQLLKSLVATTSGSPAFHQQHSVSTVTPAYMVIATDKHHLGGRACSGSYWASRGRPPRRER